MNQLKIAKQIPFNVLVKRIFKRFFTFNKVNYSAKDYRTLTTTSTINSLVHLPQIVYQINPANISHYLNHKFDLLGSGWISRNSPKKTTVHPKHQKITTHISSLITENYQFINWQKEVKTGHEYAISKAFYHQITPKGVDIKDVWELGRLQHLPQMALSAANNNDKTTLFSEFKNQCLDFIAHNPVGMGIHWACPMEVAIRISNMLLAYDLFNDTSDKQFEKILINSAFQHAWFIEQHIEQKEGLAGNHYLFNLVGLLFVANYLSIYHWKLFAEQEIEKELIKQFFDDGGNFEGSTTYHCLSAEAILYAFALILRNHNQLNVTIEKLVLKIALFIKDVSKPNGEMPQFGDNDSGRLFKLTDEDNNLLNYESLLAAFSGIFKHHFDEFKDKFPIHHDIVCQLTNTKRLNPSISKSSLKTATTKLNFDFKEQTVIKFEEQVNTDELQPIFYPDFGLYGFKSSSFYLMVSAISNAKMHHSWGHVHNDKLSFELQINSKDLVKDAGTYVYTPYPAQRNLFRSTKAHHGILVNDIEQNKMIAPFYMDREVKCILISFDLDNKIIALKATYYGVEHLRKFEIIEDKLIVKDSCNNPFKVNINQFKEYSPKYGVKE